jgi:hypothetical protein
LNEFSFKVFKANFNGSIHFFPYTNLVTVVGDCIFEKVTGVMENFIFFYESGNYADLKSTN